MNEKVFHERIKEELTAVDIDTAYDEFLDEVYSGCDLCRQYGASRILKEVDQVSYRCGKNDWLDGEDLFELDDEYYRQSEVDRIKADVDLETTCECCAEDLTDEEHEAGENKGFPCLKGNCELCS